MDYFHNVLPPSQLLRLSASALNELLLKWRSKGVQHPRPISDFDISNDTGFLPSEPLQRLPPAFEFWERALAEASSSLTLGNDESEDGIAKREDGQRWRNRIREGPLLSVHSILGERRILQRAHLVLAYLTHFYVHSIPAADKSEQTTTIIPKTLSIPFFSVSNALGIAPILTYADTVLWNVQPINPLAPLSIDNMTFGQTFSETNDEMEFYRASAGVELRGVELLHIIEDFISLPDMNDDAAVYKVSRDLHRVVQLVEDLGDIMKGVLANCDRNTFYNCVRPWFRGSDADGPTSQRWTFEGVDDSEIEHVSGPSGGQSTVIHALDVWLDIDHKLAQRRHPAPSPDNKRADHGFMQRMRHYMPGLHRDYLLYLENSPRQLRDIAKQNAALREPYNAAVKALKKFRDAHIRIVCLYVINPSRAQCPMMASIARQQRQEVSSGPARGTGGTELASLLKAGRDATDRARLD